jgi:outer membrane lipoprotein LolB
MPQSPVLSAHPAQTWAEQQSTLAQMTNWRIQALVGVVLNQQAESANVIWQQYSDEHYSIEFYGALGLGATYLKGQPGSVTLTDHEGKTYHANNPEQLMQQALGWSLPLDGLVYWIRGLPVPNVPYQSTLNPYGTLATLSQQGWTIQYLNEQRLGNRILPSKIKLKNEGLSVTIVIHTW